MGQGVSGRDPNGEGAGRPTAGLSVYSGAYSPRGVEGQTPLTAEQRELMLDVTQICLDIAGFFDPTPIADGTNAAISVGRGDWTGAGLSAVAIIPYVGDLAKAGKLGRYVQTVEKVVSEARRNARFAERVRPLLMRLRTALSEVPSKLLPQSARAQVDRLKQQLDDFLGKVPLANSRLIDDYLRRFEKRIDDLVLDIPPRDRGALWSKLDVKDESAPGFFRGGDDESIEGHQLAWKLAKQQGRRTLEMALESSKFADEFRAEAAQLAEKLGREVKWSEFGAKVWERISVKYVRALKGKVTVYVDDWVLQKALKEGNYPILSKELQELIRRKNSGEGITGIVIRDIFEKEPIFEI